MMLWYVNPLSSSDAVNLAMIKAISLKDNIIYFDENTTWIFKSNEKAEMVYEELIRTAQEYRYRK